MDERTNNRRDPWDQSIYETGRTQPPKSHGGLIALLLIFVIFLGGLVSVLGVLNVKLFNQLQNLNVPEEDTLSIVNESDETEAVAETAASVPASPMATLPPDEDSTFTLNPSPEAVPNIQQEGGMALQDIYAKTIDSVVSISCQEYAGSSTGTGVILSDNGFIVTNCHVVEGAVRISVHLTDGRSFDAALVGADAISDLAVLHIEADGLNAAEFGDSTALRVGDSVVAIGDPLGLELRGSMTDGIISAINRDVTTGGRTLTLIQTNAALNSGNSGGPLINCYGQVIGINTLKIGDLVSSAGVEGLGFAIPSTTVKEIVDQLMEQGYVSGRPTLGIIGERISTFYQLYYNMPAGLYITELLETSDAALKGIEPGDILISIDNARIASMDDLNTLLYSYQVGDSVNAVIYRAGQQYRISLTLTESKG